MKFTSFISLFLLAVSAQAFAPSQRVFVRPSGLRMSEESAAPTKPKPAPAKSSGGSLVPIKEETVEFTAGILGAVAGFAIGGPVLAAIGAAAANYASKSESEISDVVSAVSKSSIQIYNYLATLDEKYDILQKAKGSLDSALTKLKAQENVDPATIDKVEKALESTKTKIAEVNDEYDLVGGGMTALGVLGDLVEKAVKKVGELNEEYKLTDKAQEALKSAVEKAKEAADKAK
jgi:hypothetical protein